MYSSNLQNIKDTSHIYIFLLEKYDIFALLKL